MTRAFVLMTAMPPTKGHLLLIQFASQLADHVEVIVSTQPGEPFIEERRYALTDAVRKVGTFGLGNVHFSFHHKTLPQEPKGYEGFWDMWTEILTTFGFKPGDYIVASETYGKKLAEEAGGIFMPYDISRDIYFSKATEVRYLPQQYFDAVLPEFQPNLRRTVTIFGAESTGKTTLSRALAKSSRDTLTAVIGPRVSHGDLGHWLPEWARPYLETVGTEITDESMTRIWEGQRALQRHGQLLMDKPFVVQDTDLFSTLGYWKYSPWSQLGPVPEGLARDAVALKSDLYIVTRSNIPFEHDAIRYGGDEREIPDEKWIELCKEYDLNYVVLPQQKLSERLYRSRQFCVRLFEDNAQPLRDYQRIGAEYANH